MKTVFHYHVLAGLHGYLPDWNEMYTTNAGAIDALHEYAQNVVDDCGDGDKRHFGYCYTGSYHDGYLEFLPKHGVEYAEVLACGSLDCLDGEQLTTEMARRYDY